MGSFRIIAITAAYFAASANPAMARASAPKSIVAEKSVSTTTKSEPPKWLEICSKIAPATSVLCSLAPLPTIFEVSRNKSVGSLPLLSYSSMTANGFVWALYGWLTDSPAVKWANIVGTLLGSYYFKEFKKYCPPGSSNLPGTMNHHIFGVTWLILANSFLVSKFPKQFAADIVGKEGILIFIILFASPLAALKNVIATKSAASIPLPFTIASTINCSLWSIVGVLLMNDFNIYFPSMMGLLCALLQLFLKGMYGGSKIETVMLQEMGKMEHTV
mmetsp:Transcript_21405/g.46485  ORF Transcript_21405/g.46485 Transcript_21405/m.46485 type:complete len:274 (+) Transcript_21405:129-950(+)